MTFKQFFEGNNDHDTTNRKKCQVEIADALRGVFKKYTLTTRRAAWEKITSRKGEEDIQKILRMPTGISINMFHNL